MNRFPFLSFRQTQVLLRVSLAIIFLAHAIVRICLPGSIQTFSVFLANKGVAFSKVIVWAITVFEVAGGVLLLLGKFTKLIAAGFIALLITGVVLIHAQMGWFVGEHGTGGCEYSFILVIAFVVIAAADKKK